MTIKVRRDTAANWTSANPTLAAGQPGYETDTGKLKFGDGATAWTSLAYFGGSATVADGDKGDITVSSSGTVWTIDAGSITLAKQADMATASVVYRKTAGAGAPEVQTLTTLKTDLGLTGTNSGDQTSVTGNAGTATALQTSRNFSISGGGITASTVGFDGTAAVVLNASVDAGHVTLTRMANLAANSIIGNNTGSSATPLALTATQVRTLINVADGATANIGTVTSVGGTGTVSGLTLTGSVTGSGNLTLGGTLSTTSAALTDFNSATRAQTEAMLVAGTNVTITPGSSGATRTLTIAASGGGGGGVTDGDKGDVVVSGTGSVWTIDSGVVTLAKMADIAANSIIGNNTGAGATPVALTAAQVRTLLNVADGATANVGTVTSVGGTGTVSGLTLTGTVTGSGNLVLGGTLSATSAALTDFNSATRAQVEAELIAGTNVTITPGSSGATRTLTIAASGGGGGSPGGATTQIQFNDAGAFGGDADFIWDKTANKLTLGGTDTGITMAGITNEPSSPASGTLHYYSKAVAGRMLPKIKGPSGLDTIMQTAIFQNRINMYVPSTGSTGTGSGTGLGPVWTSGGTVTHPNPSSAAPAISNQMARTRYANVVTTTNQTLGIRSASSSDLKYWRGNAAGLGGFFFAARFIIELYPASTVRIFAGLAAVSGLYIVASDTVNNNTCGLWHDTTDPSTGAGAFNFVTRDTTTTTKQAITLANAIAAGNSYDFYMWCAPNGSTLYWRLDDIVNNVVYEGNTGTTLPAATAFMGPQCAMSNGTANIALTTVAIGIAGVYTEADR